MTRGASFPSALDAAPALAMSAAVASQVRRTSDLTNRHGSTTQMPVQPVPLSPELQRAYLGLLLPTFQTTLTINQTIPAGYTSVVFGTLLIASGVILTIELGAHLIIVPFPTTYTPPEINQDSQAPFGNVTISANYSAIINRMLTIASGKSLTLIANSRFRVL